MAIKVKDRPARTYVTGRVTRGLRYFAIVAVAAMCVYVALTYQSLPETVPTHFDFTGEADDWGPKWTVLLLLGINIVMVGVMAWLSGRPKWFNYPGDVTEANAQFMYREGERTLVWMNVALVAVFYGAILSIYEIDNPFLVLGLISMPALVITGMIRLSFAGDKQSHTTEAADEA